MIRLLILFICYFQSITGMVTGPTTLSRCGSENECIIIKDCKSYMSFIGSFEKPLKPLVVEFLRERHCGFERGFPKVCCSDTSKDDIASTLPKKNYKSCNKKNKCLPLKDCRPYMDLTSKMEKPLKPVVVEFLRSQQCGFQEDYPMVCCSLLPKNFQILKHNKLDSRSINFKKQNKLSSTEFDLKDTFSKVETTAKPLLSDGDATNKDKYENFNEGFDISDFFDFTGSFDLLGRKRFNNGFGIDIEIR